ncbi:MAG: quinoprotein dehydrogenase-associated putative ABC transporter substrate-binding protein [Granulosicoccus sp.]|nr:quinoprotein dehydrogenase-associated putative ABC transporter substrate-binding protein [Granulosicoccus sp.]
MNVAVLILRDALAVLNRLPIFLCCVALLFGSSVQAADTGRQALTTGYLRVCADPSNLPFSDKNLNGFENKIIALIAGKLGLETRYTWYPQSTGFVRNTLRVRECDLVSGITTTSQTVQNTNPYYHSVYTMVYRKDSGITATTIADPQLKGKKLGVVAGTPPANILAQHGLLPSVKPYQLVADTRRELPASQAISDVDSGATDVAFIWGPIAAYYAAQADNPLAVVPLVNENRSTRLNFRVSMAVRYNETDWKRKVNSVLKELAPEIQVILNEYDIPLLDDRGNLISQ